MISRVLIIGVLGVILQSCSNNHVEPIVGQAPYFKLNKWLNNESDRLKSEDLAINRLLQTDQKIAHAPTDSNNWEDWFKPLSECDLSKPAYHGFYQVDTLLSSDTAIVNYQALKLDAVVRSLEITFIKDKPIRVNAHKVVNNLLYRSEAKILYIKDSLYQVDYLQETKFFDQHHFNAKYTFHQK